MKINTEDLIREYYQKRKSEYPQIDYNHFKLLIKTPWIFLKRTMESGTLESVRFKYFGIFTVYKGRVKFLISKTKENFKKGYINEKQMNRYITILQDYLNEKD